MTMTAMTAIEVVWHLHRAEATETTITTMITPEDALENDVMVTVTIQIAQHHGQMGTMTMMIKTTMTTMMTMEMW